MIAEGNEPEQNRFDNKVIPTFLQKTYALVEVEKFNLEPRIQGNSRLGHRFE
jgi:hypothetical protein